jgi:hypothetical protein
MKSTVSRSAKYRPLVSSHSFAKLMIFTLLAMTFLVGGALAAQAETLLPNGDTGQNSWTPVPSGTYTGHYEYVSDFNATTYLSLAGGSGARAERFGAEDCSLAAVNKITLTMIGMDGGGEMRAVIKINGGSLTQGIALPDSSTWGTGSCTWTGNWTQAQVNAMQIAFTLNGNSGEGKVREFCADVYYE